MPNGVVCREVLYRGATPPGAPPRPYHTAPQCREHHLYAATVFTSTATPTLSTSGSHSPQQISLTGLPPTPANLTSRRTPLSAAASRTPPPSGTSLPFAAGVLRTTELTVWRRHAYAGVLRPRSRPSGESNTAHARHGIVRRHVTTRSSAPYGMSVTGASRSRPGGETHGLLEGMLKGANTAGRQKRLVRGIIRLLLHSSPLMGARKAHP